MTNPRTILTSLHGHEIGLNHDRKLTVKKGYVIEGTAGALLKFDSEGIAVKSLEAYAQLTSTQNQIPVDTNPRLVTHNNTDSLVGLAYASDTITIQSAGTYLVVVGGQVAKASGTGVPRVSVWLRRNGVDVPRSGVSNTVQANVASTSVTVTNYLAALAVGDTIQVYMAVDTVTGSPGLYSTTIPGGPTVPSVITSIFKVR